MWVGMGIEVGKLGDGDREGNEDSVRLGLGLGLGLGSNKCHKMLRLHVVSKGCLRQPGRCHQA